MLSSLNLCLHWYYKPIVGKTAHTLVGIKALTPYSISSHYTIHHQALKKKTHKNSSLRDSLMKEEKHFIKILTLKHTFSISSVTKSTHTVFLLHSKMMVVSKKSTVKMSELQAELATFFMEHHFFFFLEHHFYFKQLTKYGFSDWEFGRHFLANKQSESVTFKKTTNNICWQE